MTVTQRPQVKAILFDLDDCLYDNPAMKNHVTENIRRYMTERLGIPADEVPEKCADYYLNFGTTLAGLVAHGQRISYDEWHAYVHGSLPYEEYLKPDPALRAMLDSIDLPKFVFTNADVAHAARCLELLGIASCFQRVVAFEDVMLAAEAEGLVHHGCPVVCKPNRQAFITALRLAGGLEPSTTLWLDDSVRNVTTGHRMGLYSVLVGRTGVDCPSDQQIQHIHDLPTALPWLWQPPATPAPKPLREDAEAAKKADENAVFAKKAQSLKGSDSSDSPRSNQQERIEAVYVAA